MFNHHLASAYDPIVIKYADLQALYHLLWGSISISLEWSESLHVHCTCFAWYVYIRSIEWIIKTCAIGLMDLSFKWILDAIFYEMYCGKLD